MKLKTIIPILALAMILMIPLASATHATSTVLHGQVLDISGVPEQNADLRVTISTANSCLTSLVYNTTFVNATNGDGVYNLDISTSLNFNQLYYTCAFVNDEQMGSPQPARIGQGQVDENDVYFTDLTIHDDLIVVDQFSAGNVNSNLIPSVNNTYDIGSLTNMWNDGFFGGSLYVEGGILGNLSYDNLIPLFDDTYYVGNETHRWKEGNFMSMGIGGLRHSTPQEALNINGSIILEGDDQWIYVDTAGHRGYDLGVIGGWGGCFPAQTMITTPSGFKDISKIDVGDIIVAYDTTTNKKTTSEVKDISSRIAHSYYKINDIEVTSEHPFYTSNGWKEARTLNQGDYLFDGSDWVYISSTERINNDLEVYNMHVTEPNNFFADGVLVHNKDTSSRPGGQLYLSGGAGNYGGADGDTYIGYDGTSLQGHVIVSDAYQLPNLDGTTDQVLTTDGGGYVTWEDAGGAGLWSEVVVDSIDFITITNDSYSLLINDSANQWISFDATDDEVYMGYFTDTFWLEAYGTGDNIYFFADENISLEANNGNIVIEGNALDMNSYPIINSGNITPYTNNTYTLGNQTNQWANIYGNGSEIFDLSLPLNEVENPNAQTSFNFGSYGIDFSFTTPSSPFEIIATGAYTGDLVHIRQHTGNPGATDLLKVEATDVDVNGIVIDITGTDAIIAGGTDGNFTVAGVTGQVILDGDARVYNTITNYAYNFWSNTGAVTYNGVACDPAGATTLGGMYYTRSYDDGGGGGKPEASLTTLTMPLDYEDGTNIQLIVHWTAVATTGNVRFGIGILPVGTGESYVTAETYQTGLDAAPGTAYARQDVTLTFTGTGYQSGDDVAIVMYRDADDGTDTMTGDAFVSTIELKYIANKLGEAI